MKTIFDKIDPQYLECASGTCGHPEHLGIIVAVITSAVLFLLYSLKAKRR